MVTDLIDEDQTGFVLDRQTQENIRRILHIIHKIQKNNNTSSIDQPRCRKGIR